MSEQRYEAQPWNDVRLSIELVDDGAGVTGKTPVATLIRTSDGQWLQSGGGWGASPSNLNLAAVDAANLPGFYTYIVDPDDLDPSDGQYIARIIETTLTPNVREHLRIVPILSAYDAQLGLDLRQNRYRVIASAWDATSKQPEAAVVYVYRTDALYDADAVPDGTGAYASFDFEALFSAGQLQYAGSRGS